MMDAVDVIQALLGEQIAGRLQAALAVEEHVPFMRIAQAHEVGAQERAGRHLAGPVEGEGVHRLEHAVLHAVEQLEIADHLLCGKGLELQLAAGLFLDGAAPGLEGLKSDPGGPGRLHLPGGGGRLGRPADERCAHKARGRSQRRRGTDRLENVPAIHARLGLLFVLWHLLLHRSASRCADSQHSLDGGYAPCVPLVQEDFAGAARLLRLALEEALRSTVSPSQEGSWLVDRSTVLVGRQRLGRGRVSGAPTRTSAWTSCGASTRNYLRPSAAKFEPRISTERTKIADVPTIRGGPVRTSLSARGRLPTG